MIRPEILPVRCLLPGPFATATGVQPAAAGQWSAAIHPSRLGIAGNANGGYLLALVGATGRPDPVTVTAPLPVPWPAGQPPQHHPSPQGGKAPRHGAPRDVLRQLARCGNAQ